MNSFIGLKEAIYLPQIMGNPLFGKRNPNLTYNSKKKVRMSKSYFRVKLLSLELTDTKIIHFMSFEKLLVDGGWVQLDFSLLAFCF